MSAVLFGVFVASLVGSVHCLAMCGPLVGLHGGARTMRLAGTHALGRMTTYVVLGVAAGLVGSAVNVAGHMANVQRAATIAAAALIVGMGIWQIAQSWRLSRIRDNSQAARVGAGTGAGSMFASALVRIRPRSAAKRSYMIGTLTGLLPCGWLWAFVIAAAGTGSPITGGLTMFAFWLGTVPAMVGLLRVTGPLLARVRARMPAITAVALIAIGLGTLALRWRDIGTQQVTHPHCHQHSGASS
jgi:sulfite exporter TauE/SafE